MELINRFIKLLLEYISNLEFNLFESIWTKKQFFRRTYLKFMNVNFTKDLRIGRDFYLKNKGKLTLGNRCCLGSFTKIWNYAPISVGDDFLASAGLVINSATHDPITLEPKGLEINIGSRVWCGINVTILAGVTIGDDVVIGAGSLVIKDIPSNSIAVGVPARKIKELNRSAPELWDFFQ